MSPRGGTPRECRGRRCRRVSPESPVDTRRYRAGEASPAPVEPTQSPRAWAGCVGSAPTTRRAPAVPPRVRRSTPRRVRRVPETPRRAFPVPVTATRAGAGSGRAAAATARAPLRPSRDRQDAEARTRSSAAGSVATTARRGSRVPRTQSPRHTRQWADRASNRTAPAVGTHPRHSRPAASAVGEPRRRRRMPRTRCEQVLQSTCFRY